MGALRDPVAPCSTWATSATHPAGTCQRGSRRPGRAHPTAELVAPLPGVGQGHPHRPCHPPTIWSTTPQVRHGQPRTLTVLDLRPPYRGARRHDGKDAVTLDGRRRDHRHSSPLWEAAGRARATGHHARRPRLVCAAAVGQAATAMEAAARPRAEPRRAGHRSDSAGHRRCYWPLGRPFVSRPEVGVLVAITLLALGALAVVAAVGPSCDGWFPSWSPMRSG
jgi:hypothetical protein